MTFPTQGEIDVISTQILLDAKQALLQLQAWNNSIKDAQEKTKLFKELIKSTAAQMNGDLKAATSAVQRFAGAMNLNPAVVAKIGKDFQALDKIAQQSLGDVSVKSIESSARITMLSNAIQAMATKGKLSIDQVVSSLRTLNSSTGYKFGKIGYSDTEITKAGEAAKQVSKEIDQVGKSSQQTAEKSTSAFGKVFNSVNALRIALGAIVSMVLFQVIQAFQQLATDSIKQFTELEDSLWRIVNVERELSKQGTEISVSGLKKGIEDIRKLLPIFSEQDISGLVGKVAISTKELGYTEQQILDLAKAISVLNVRSTENEDLNQTASKVITALLSGTTKGVSGLGVQLNDTVIKTKAVEMGLLKASDSLEKLNNEQKGLVKLQIILQGTSGELENISEYLDTNSAKLKENSAAWDDFKASIGGLTSSAIPELTEFIKILTVISNGIKSLIVFFDTAQAYVGYFSAALWSGKNALDGMAKAVGTLKDLPKIFDAIAQKEVKNLFAKMPEDAPKWFQKVFGPYLKDVETATDLTAKFNDEVANNEEAQKALDDLDQKLQEYILDAQQAQSDLDLKLKQKQEDLDTEYKRKNEDAARDHAQKLEDIELDTQRKIADAKTKAREDERKAEQDLLQKLKELRERFLLDLEEALHNRDARQVIRLIKEYNLEKQNILDKKKLDDQQRKEKLADDLKAIELERQHRIENENIEYKRKLADLAKAKAREQEELKLWYQREQEDIKRNLEQKIQKLLAGYADEEKLHESEQSKIYEILKKYLGKDMALVDELAKFMATRMAQVQAMAAMPISTAPVGSLNYNLGLPDKTNPFAGSYSDPLGNTGGKVGKAMASGGTIVTDKPTIAMFGEAGPESATFIPLNKSREFANQNLGGSPVGINGQIVVSVDLSDGLEARIVNKSMDGVANVLSKINRRKN